MSFPCLKSSNVPHRLWGLQTQSQGKCLLCDLDPCYCCLLQLYLMHAIKIPDFLLSGLLHNQGNDNNNKKVALCPSYTDVINETIWIQVKESRFLFLNKDCSSSNMPHIKDCIVSTYTVGTRVKLHFPEKLLSLILKLL